MQNFHVILKNSFTFIIIYLHTHREEIMCTYKHLCSQFNNIFLSISTYFDVILTNNKQKAFTNKPPNDMNVIIINFV